MEVFFVSLVVFALMIAAMAVGVMSGRAPLKGSCGGLGKLGVSGACEICGGDVQRCDRQPGDSGAGSAKSFADRSADH